MTARWTGSMIGQGSTLLKGRRHGAPPHHVRRYAVDYAWELNEMAGLASHMKR